MADKILIIEDEEEIGEILEAYIEKMGHETTVCSNGEDGLKLLNEQKMKVWLCTMLQEYRGRNGAAHNLEGWFRAELTTDDLNIIYPIWQTAGVM